MPRVPAQLSAAPRAGPLPVVPQGPLQIPLFAPVGPGLTVQQAAVRITDIKQVVRTIRTRTLARSVDATKESKNARATVTATAAPGQ